ncbi:MAG: diaminopimelate decarboxylase [Anaerolineae bacterium]
MPISPSFRHRLFPVLEAAAAAFGTPFHLYDETGIRETGQRLAASFGALPGFREYFAVKALPNPAILRLMHEMGFGFDCSSIPELVLSRKVGAASDAIMFTSNNTAPHEFEEAFDHGGCILNLDDITLLEKLPSIPDLIAFRYNPGAIESSNRIIGDPAEAKFGVSRDQIEPAYRRAIELGVRRFGLHTMVVSNERNYQQMVRTTGMLLDQVERLSAALGIRFEFINIGGGLGIPYRPDDASLDLEALSVEITRLMQAFESKHGYAPKLYMESGRYMTGPHGVLVTRAINRKDTYRTYIGVDASMSALMRPAIYGAYHHIDVVGKEGLTVSETVDVVGSLCENNDKFAVQRALPRIQPGDLLVIHDTGAHGHSMGFTYNGRLRPQELLLRADGSVERIRRAETLDDYFATLNFEPRVFHDTP